MDHDPLPSSTRRSLFGTVLRDVQFWIPVIVLLGGLVVLRFVAG